ncbi:MAG: FAD-binding oxidoreductase [Bacteroidota bacterium]
MKKYESWGRYPRVEHSRVERVLWRDGLPDLSNIAETILPYGYGRSYGDSCLNEGAALLDMSQLNRFLAFDAEQGILRCESGMRFDEILKVIVPRGWFLPVTPGTKFVSVGGAIANDVHGKNHHSAGTFGCHVLQFELVRSDGKSYICSPTENTDLFKATIGGLGLTGIVTWVSFSLKKIHNPFIEMENIKFSHVDDFFEISDEGFESVVSWIDCSATGKNLGRGHFTRGNHAGPHITKETPGEIMLPFPIDAPEFLLNNFTVKAFNSLYYHRQIPQKKSAVVHYNPFYYPLDMINGWNKMYGKRGFLQYQYVIPFNGNEKAVTRDIVSRIAKAGTASFLAVLKKFGNIQSPGIMSFPRPGVTLALDFSFGGDKTLKLLKELDEIIMENNGAVYPAKDARMSPESFKKYFPQWEYFSQFIDPKFSSSFWRRVTS